MIEPEHKKLNLGCGHTKLLDYWNVDIDTKCSPDQVIDLNDCPWDLPSDFFETINLDNVLGYLGESNKVFTDIIKELYRVSKDQANWNITFPHHRSDSIYDDYSYVRVLTGRTFKLFDQKYNFETIAKKRGENVYGFIHQVDLENVDILYNISKPFIELAESGMLGNRQLDIKLNTLSNVCDTINVSIKVHKPGRYVNWYKTIGK